MATSLIHILTLKITWVPKSANVEHNPIEYLKSVNTLQNGFDYSAVREQAGIDTAPAPYTDNLCRIAVGGFVIKGHYREFVDPTTGLTAQSIPYHFNVALPEYSDVTVENAYQRYLSDRMDSATKIGVPLLEAWYQDYQNTNFTITHTAEDEGISNSQSIQMWLEHRYICPDPVLDEKSNFDMPSNIIVTGPGFDTKFGDQGPWPFQPLP